jgi:ATP-dependent DNA ligase
MPVKVLADLRRRLDPLARAKSPLSLPPPRKTRFGSPLVLSRVHWVEPKLVAEITYLTWTADGLLRHHFSSASARTSRRSRCGGRFRESGVSLFPSGGLNQIGQLALWSGTFDLIRRISFA